MPAHPQTYALTATSAGRRAVFQRAANAELLIATLLRYRDEKRFLLHGFVVMPEHVHVLLTPTESIEKAAQLIKGGYSFAVRKQFPGQIWNDGYFDHRIRDAEDYRSQLTYIARNPAKRGLVEYPYVHTYYEDHLDPTPPPLVG